MIHQVWFCRGPFGLVATWEINNATLNTFPGTSWGIFRAVDVTLGLRGKSLYRLVVRTSRCGRDNPGSTPGEDILSPGACSPEPPKGALSASMLAFTMAHLPSMLEGQRINGLVVEYIVAIDVTSNPFAVAHCRLVTPWDCSFCKCISQAAESVNQSTNQSIIGLFSLAGRAPAE